MVASGLLDILSGHFQSGGDDDSNNDQLGIGSLGSQNRKRMFGQAAKRGGITPRGDLDSGQGSYTQNSLRRAQKGKDTLQHPAAGSRNDKSHKGKECAHSFEPARAAPDSQGRIIDDTIHGEEDEAAESPAESPILFGVRVGPDHSP